jgi:predicted nucleic acid-binding protein
MPTIPDSNVLLDLILRDPVWFNWSAQHLADRRQKGELYINPIIFSESSGRFTRYLLFQRVLERLGVALEQLPWEAAFEAGKAHIDYRKAGGPRSRTLPDFLVGAHAMVKGYTLLTRDAARYRSYFPKLDIIAPDTHP